MPRRQGAGKALRPAPGAWNPQDDLREPILAIGAFHGQPIVTARGGPARKRAKTQAAADKIGGGGAAGDQEILIIEGPAKGNRVMTISGLLITLAEDPQASDAAISALEADPRIDVGERNGSYLPLVTDTPGEQESRRLWDKLNELAGVINVNLVFTDLDDFTETIRHVDA
jgi:nitrate reductase NapAB chaperone NapD